MATPEQVLDKLRGMGWILTAAFVGLGFIIGSEFSWWAGVCGAALLGLPIWLWQRWQMARVIKNYEREMAVNPPDPDRPPESN